MKKFMSLALLAILGFTASTNAFLFWGRGRGCCGNNGGWGYSRGCGGYYNDCCGNDNCCGNGYGYYGTGYWGW